MQALLEKRAYLSGQVNAHGILADEADQAMRTAWKALSKASRRGVVTEPEKLEELKEAVRHAALIQAATHASHKNALSEFYANEAALYWCAPWRRQWCDEVDRRIELLISTGGIIPMHPPAVVPFPSKDNE